MNRGAKVNLYFYCFICYLALAFLPASSFAQFILKIKAEDQDSIFVSRNLGLESVFANRDAGTAYITTIPALLRKQGYIGASVDSIQFDSSFAIVQIFVGEKYQWGQINIDSVDEVLLKAASWNRRSVTGQPMDPARLETARQKMLDYLENNGYPFAEIRLDSMEISGGVIGGTIKVNKGPLYRIDSVRNLGNASISSVYLERYLNLEKGSPYNKEQLGKVSSKLLELPFVKEQRPWDLTMLGTGSVLNLYLEPKKSSKIDVLVGLLPANTQLEGNKMLVTGEANINLRNALGSGETIGLEWQQIQVKSPRLNLLFQQPFLFNSPFGVNFNFDLFKKDSSFVNINAQLGAQYTVSSRQSGSVFIQSFSTNLLDVDTNRIKSLRRLPEEADLRSVSMGVSYKLNGTDYQFNPRKGNEIDFSVSAGIRTIKENNVIAKLQDTRDPGFDFRSLYDTMETKTYQFRLNLTAAHYFPVTRSSTFKLAVNGGWVQSPMIFRNELFQIGGYRLLRGFDEESIFASRYGVATGEYRYFLGQNSFLFSFVDLGWIANRSLSRNLKNSYLGAGLGMAFETKAGIFNISYAAGKRNDVPFDLRQSKIHLGYVNYF